MITKKTFDDDDDDNFILGRFVLFSFPWSVLFLVVFIELSHFFCLFECMKINLLVDDHRLVSIRRKKLKINK